MLCWVKFVLFVIIQYVVHCTVILGKCLDFQMSQPTASFATAVEPTTAIKSGKMAYTIFNGEVDIERFWMELSMERIRRGFVASKASHEQKCCTLTCDCRIV